ncbi:MAG: hypothetical protein HRU26_03605, partial [Psychroserpens sp.]|nr:hypothetical protein [Psychroserpens sp.]
NSGGQYGQRHGIMANGKHMLEGHMSGGKIMSKYQMGAEMGAEGQEMAPGAESHQMAQEMMAQNAAQDPNAMPQDPSAMPPEDMAVQGQIPAPIAQLPEPLQQLFMSMPPEMQNQILQLPPDQIPVAIQAMAQQMQGGAGGPEGMAQAGPQQAGPSPVPQGVIDQMG